MSALIIRMPQEKRERLKMLAQSRNASVNELIEEMATVMIAEFDAETHFRLRAARIAAEVAGTQAKCCASLYIMAIYVND